MSYPVAFEVKPSETYDKAQVALRVLIFIIVGWLVSWVTWAAYWLFPVIAAVMVSQKGPEQYLASAESGPTRWLRYVMGIYSYFALASDKLPFDDPDSVVELQVQTNGKPTVGSSLLRVFLGIPHAIVIGLLGIVFFFIWLIAAISILISGTYPDWAASFIQGYLRWIARLLAYMASLVDEYPPFAFDAGTEGPSTAQPVPPPAEPPATPQA